MPRPRLRRLLGPGGSGGRWRGPEGPRVATECPGGSPLPAPAAAAAPDAQAGSVRERHARGSSLVPGAGRALAGRRAPEPGEERAPPGPRAPSSGAAGSGPGAVPGADDSAARGARIRDLPPTRGRPAPPRPCGVRLLFACFPGSSRFRSVGDLEAGRSCGCLSTGRPWGKSLTWGVSGSHFKMAQRRACEVVLRMKFNSARPGT